ncbi:unannotated protein [freshwater metagenome]|uniref:Unannotated protein n=1 Tax=freshwater metagenome TaxID=449393 RepID=A0A6J6F4I6_9ZZZZ
MRVDRRDDVPIDFANQHHSRNVECFGIGNPQTIFEFRRDAEPLEEVADLRAATVHNDNPDAHRMQQDDVGRERFSE